MMKEGREKKTIVELTRISTESYRRLKKLPLALLLDNVRSMHNVGSLLRTSDAFLVEEVIMCGITGCPPDAKITKTALGAEDSVRWRYSSSALEETARMQREGWKVLVLEQTHGSVNLEDFTPRQGERYLLVCGNEVSGVDQGIVDLADTVLEIAQSGTKHSLNVAVSAGIALYRLYSQLGE